MARNRGGSSNSSSNRTSDSSSDSNQESPQDKRKQEHEEIDGARQDRREDGRKSEDSPVDDFETTGGGGGFSDGAEVVEALEPPPPGDGDNIQQMVEEAGMGVTAVNWIFEQVTGESLVEMVIMPITGDFNKIQQNSEAWNTVANAVDQLGATMESNAEVVMQQWKGDAADSHANYIGMQWKAGLMVESQIAKMIAKGFTMVADGSQRLCSLALDLLQKLIDKLIQAAAKACVPVAGWVAAATIVWDAYQLYQKILDIIDTVQSIIENVGKLWESLQNIGSQLGKIKEIDDIGDVTSIASNIGSEVKDAKGSVEDIKDDATNIKHRAAGINDTSHQSKAETERRLHMDPVGASSGTGRISGTIPPE